MKRFLRIKFSLVLLIGLATTAFPQTADADHVKVPISDPSRPCTVRVNLISGSISVKGYSGDEIVVDAGARDSEEHGQAVNSKSAGMRKISDTSTGLIIEEENNSVRIAISKPNRPVDITIQVPSETNLKLSAVNDGDILVEQVQGEIEVKNTNGAVTLTQVSGSVVAHALNKHVKVSFLTVDPRKPMSFSSLNGDIDVTLPSDVKANVSMKSFNGDIYSDFDIMLDARGSQSIMEDTDPISGMYRIKKDRSTKGMINGGGQEMRFETFNGDIYIRKSSSNRPGG